MHMNDRRLKMFMHESEFRHFPHTKEHPKWFKSVKRLFLNVNCNIYTDSYRRRLLLLLLLLVLLSFFFCHKKICIQIKLKHFLFGISFLLFENGMTANERRGAMELFRGSKCIFILRYAIQIRQRMAYPIRFDRIVWFQTLDNFNQNVKDFWFVWMTASFSLFFG